MGLTEFGKQWLRASFQEEGARCQEREIQYFEEHLDAARILVPASAEHQAAKHQLGGASHALDVAQLLQKGDLSAAQQYVDELRQQVTASSRGVAKDALPMLQAFSIIDEALQGPISPLPEESLNKAICQFELTLTRAFNDNQRFVNMFYPQHTNP